MGIPDYDMMFDLLDTRMCGYLSVEQLQDFQTQVYFAPLDQRQIEAAVYFVCGKNSQLKCTKEYFGNVVEEIGRRVLLEESIAWDFKCLDVLGGCNLICHFDWHLTILKRQLPLRIISYGYEGTRKFFWQTFLSVPILRRIILSCN